MLKVLITENGKIVHSGEFSCLILAGRNKADDTVCFVSTEDENLEPIIVASYTLQDVVHRRVYERGEEVE